jgi:cytochrome c oxidase subunit 2
VKPGRVGPLLVFAVLASASCSGAGSIMDPAGPAARRVAGLWWLMLAISAVVFAVVLALMTAAILKGRRSKDAAVDRRQVRWGDPFVIVSGVAIPSLILAGMFLLSLRDMNALSKPDEEPTLTVEVVAHDWWWEVSYPHTDAVTANEIHIPAGEPVRMVLTTGDVIHSFWVPRLQVKMDMIEGRANEIWLEADRPGRYRGQCAEFCGLQHANMLLWVIAEPRQEFESWLADQSADAAVTEGNDGLDVFLDSTCVGCHAIRGTEATSTEGPDLTHLAGRDTIAGGILRNTRANLARFVTDPQAEKPGAAMPPTELSADQLEALLDYLETLE